MKAIRTALAIVLTLSLAASAAAGYAEDAPLGIQTVESSEYPRVSIHVTVPPVMSAEQPRFELSENDEPVRDVAVESLTKEAAPAQVMLVIDTSGSMRGEALEHAQAAARDFVDAMGANASIAIVSFDDKPRVVTGYTTDRSRLASAIGSLKAAGETSLYDALVTASNLIPLGADARRSIIVLSDGGDTVSNASFEKTVGELKEAGVPLYAVALESDEYNPNALTLLAKQTGGRFVPVAKSSELAALFQGIAEEISNVWVLNYTSARPRTADIEVDVKATGGDAVAVASIAFRNPGLGALGSDTALRIPVTPENPATLMGVVLLAFGAVALLATGVMLIVLRQRPNLAQLKYYDQLQEGSEQGRLGTDDIRSKVVDAVGYVAGRRGLTHLAAVKLEAAGLRLRPEEHITVHLVLVIALGVLVEFLTGRVFLAVATVCFATVLPIVAISSMSERRRGRFSAQLPDVLGMISGSLRAGWGMQQAVALCVQEAPQPSSAELKRVETETRLGMPLERAMENMAERMQSDDFRAVVNAVAIQRDIGGNLAEVLDIVAKTIREREAMRRQIKALTAEGRISAYILVALPFVVFSLLVLLNPTYILPLVTTPSGLVMLAVAIVLLITGTIWVFSVTRIEV